MKNSIILILFFAHFNSHSQIVFEKYYGTIGGNNVGFYVHQASNGYIISGSKDNDGVIIRTNEFGDSLWQQNYSNGSAECLRPSGNGGFVLAGTDYNSPYNAVFRQVDSSGSVVWDTITSSSPFTRYGIAAMQMPDGDYALLENDAYPFLEYLRIRKISAANRSTIWTKEISIVANCSSSSFQLTYDSAIVVANGTFDTPYPRLILSKTLSNGTLNWKKDYSFLGDTGIAGNSFAQTTDSGFIVIGYKVFGNPQSQSRLFLMKTKANGDSLWTKVYNLKNSNAFPDIIQTSDGGYALIGTVVYPPNGGDFDYRIIMMKTDSNGDSLWTKEFIGYGLNEAKKIIQTSDGGFAILGTSTDQNFNQNYIYFIKTDSLGGIIVPTMISSEPIENDFIIYPNPVSNLATLQFFGEGLTTIRISNMNGKLIKIILNESLNPGIHELPVDCNGMAKGCYTIEITDRINIRHKKLFFIF